MALDASIYARFARKSVADYNKEAYDAEASQQAVGINKLRLLAGQRADEDAMRTRGEADSMRNALSGLGSGATTDARINALEGLGTQTGFTQADALRKGQFEQQKTRATIGKDDAETSGKKLDQSIKAHEFHVQQLGAVNNPDDAAAWAQQGLQAGVFTPEQYQRGIQAIQQASQSPETFAKWRQQSMQGGMSVLQQMQTKQATIRDEETGRHNRAGEGNTLTVAQMNDARIKAEGAANRGVSMRGQNLTDARSRESTAAAMTKPFEVTGPDGTPILVQQDKQGNIQPVQGFGPKGGAEKPLTEGQAKALAFAARMQASNEVIAKLAGGGTEVSVPGSRAGLGIGAAINAMSPDRNQQLDQAKRDFVNAVLRRESGAVISDSEFNNAEKQYFPQVGDRDPVKKQKAENRRIALDGMKADIPTARKGQVDAIAKPSQPSAGALSPAEQAELDALRKRFNK